PGLSLYRVFYNREKHFACHPVIEADLCQPSSYVLSDLLVSIGGDDYECPGFSAYYLVEPAIQLVLEPCIFDLSTGFSSHFSPEALELVNIYDRWDRACIVQESAKLSSAFS